MLHPGLGLIDDMARTGHRFSPRPARSRSAEYLLDLAISQVYSLAILATRTERYKWRRDTFQEKVAAAFNSKTVISDINDRLDTNQCVIDG
jgi:hypothetical protein